MRQQVMDEHLFRALRGDLRKVIAYGPHEAHATVFDEAHGRSRRDRLGRRSEGEDCIERHWRGVRLWPQRPERLVQDDAPPARDEHDERMMGAVFHPASGQLLDVLYPRWRHSGFFWCSLSELHLWPPF